METNHPVLGIVIEGLGRSLVGAYGANTARTPAIDQLAAHGAVLDHCFVDSLDRRAQLTSLWSGTHALQTGRDTAESLWKSCERAGMPTQVLTDCAEVAELAEQFGCSDVSLVELKQPTVPATQTSESIVLPLFAAAAEQIATQTNGLLWIHSRGLRHPWDAPVELRNQFKDPDDPDPPEGLEPVSDSTHQSSDPDWIIGWGQVAAAQSSIIDEGVETLMASMQTSSHPWQGLLMSLGGVPVGENQRVGWSDSSLSAHENQLATIAVVFDANSDAAGIRRPELFQLPDLHATLAAELGIKAQGIHWGTAVQSMGAAPNAEQWPPNHQVAVVQLSTELTWIRTPAWSARFDGDECQLFVKPDDRWEVTDVADRRPDIVAQLQQIASHFRDNAIAGRRSPAEPIASELACLLR